MRYRHLRRTIIALMAAVAVLLVVGTVLVSLLHSRAFCRWTARLLELRVAAELDATLEIGELRWRLLPPRAELTAVRFTRAGLDAEIEHLQVNLNELRFLRPAVQLGTVAADGVSLRLRGLPERPPRQRTTPLRVELRQLDLRRVRLEGSELPGSFERVAIAGLDAGWTEQGGALQGYLRIDRIGLELRGIEPIEAAARARFQRQAGGLALRSWAVTAPGLDLHGDGQVTGEGRIELTGQGRLQLEELDRVVRANGVLAGSCELGLDLDSGRDDILQVAIFSPRTDAAGFRLRQMQGTVLISKQRLHGDLERAVLAGGQVHGSYTLGAGMRRPYPHRVQLQGHGLGLAGILASLKVPAAGLAATTEVELALAWNGRHINQGTGTATVDLAAAPGTLPVSGELALRLSPDGLLHFATEALKVGHSTMRWQGPLTVGSWVPAWSFRASPAVLEELLPMVNTWIGSPVLPEQLRGQGELQVTIAGPWQHLQAGIRLETGRLDYPPLVLDRLLAEASVAGSTLKIGPARYQLGSGTGEVEGRLSWATAEPEQQLDLSLRGQGIPAAALAAWLGLEQGVSGTVAFTGGLRGPLAAPRGSWAVALSSLRVAGLVLGDGSATLDLAERVFTARGVSFSEGLQGGVRWLVPAAQVTADLAWPEMSLAALGDRVAGLLGERADATLRCTWTEGQPLVATLGLQGAALQLELVKDERSLHAEANLRDAVTLAVHLDQADGGPLQGDGELRLLAAEQLVAHLLPGSGVPLTGHGHLSFSADWPANAWPVIQGTADALDLTLAGRPASLLAPAPFTLSRDGLSIGGMRLSLLDDVIDLRGTVGSDGSLKGRMSGTLDALLLRFLVPGWEPAGRIAGEVELLGSLEHPRLEGATTLSEVSLRLPGSRQVVSHIGGSVLLSPQEIRVEGVDLRFLQGTGTCSGRITTGGSTTGGSTTGGSTTGGSTTGDSTTGGSTTGGSTTGDSTTGDSTTGDSTTGDSSIELLLYGTVADLEQPLLPGLTPRVSGSWRLEGPAEQLELSGELQIDSAVLRRKDDLMTILLDWFESDLPAAGAGIGLNLRVTADRTIEARSPFLNLSSSASLLVTGTSTRPGLVGTIEVHEGGDLTFQGVRYEIERGTLTFTDPTTIDPLVELQARAWVQSYQVTVRLHGTTDRLVPVLSSDPPLSEGEIISLLALGWPDESVGGGAMGVGLASTLLTRQLNAELERRARTLLPVDQLRVDPYAEHATGNPAARVTMVKQLSPSWTIILQSNLSSNREEVLLSRWFLGPGVFLEATRDVDGSYGIDLKLRRSY